MDHPPGANRWTRTNSESCLPRPESKTVRFNAEEVGNFILVTENTTKNPQKVANFGREIPDGPIIIWPESLKPCQGLKSTESTSRIRTRDYQDQDLYHSERAFRGFLLGPTIGVKLGSLDKAHLSNKIKVAWFYPMSTRTKVISFGSLQLAFKRYNSPDKNG